MGLNTSAYQEYAPGKVGSADYYGDADYNRDKAAGMSDSAILSRINANPSKMGNGGVGGDLYNRISAGARSGSGGSSGGGGGGNSYNPSPVSSRPYAPPSVIAPPDEVFGNDDDFSYEAFLADRREKRQAAKDLAEMYAQNSDGDLISTVNIDQNVGSFKNFDNSVTGNDNVLENVGNDYSFNQGQLKLVNVPFGVA